MADAALKRRSSTVMESAVETEILRYA